MKVLDLEGLTTYNENLLNKVEDMIPEQIQSDWDINDETNKAYIKNRICYTEDPVDITILEETTLDGFSDSSDIPYGSIIDISTAFEVGQFYTVVLDGITYNNLLCYIDLDYNNNTIGSKFDDVMSNTEVLEYPFCLVTFVNNGQNKLVIVSADTTSTSHTISITQHKITTVQLPEKYISYKPGLIVSGNIYTIDETEVMSKIGAEIFNDYSNNIAIGTTSHAEGGNTISQGDYSHAEGYNTISKGDNSHAEGNQSLCIGFSSHAEGYSTTAKGDASHAEGNYTRSDGSNSHAEGYFTTTSGGSAHAEGYNTSAGGNYSHAEGSQSSSSGTASHAEGNSTKAYGSNAHSEGNNTKANSSNSHTEGEYTIATSKNQHVQGKYNIEDSSNTYAHIVGNGTSDTDRSNAHTLDWNGNAWFQGNVYIGGTSQSNATKLENVQSDWNVNDENNNAYIKNRICYTTDPVDTTILAETTIDFTDMLGTMVTDSISGVELEVGQYYTVIWDSIEYNDLICFNDNGYLTIGAPYDSLSTSEYPFCMYMTTHNALHIASNDTANTSHTISIIAHIRTDVQLPKKYISYKPGLIVFGETYTIDSEDVTALEGAEIFNNYSDNVATGYYAHSEGDSTKATGDFSHAEGLDTIATAYASHAEGSGTTASGDRAHAEGRGTKASGYCSHSEGSSTVASGYCSHSSGVNTTALDYQYVIGHYNNTTTATADTSTGSAFVIGNGTYETPSNAFRVTYDGNVYATGTSINTGADYAEYFEWEDGNIDNEDRVGYFVTLNNNKIRKATSNDYILGIVSGTASIIGNGDEDWRSKFIHDDFGRLIYETYNDEEGNQVTFPKVNPDYDSSRGYIQRADRQEWSAVGMIGVVYVRDDGTCKVNEYCKCNDNGIASHTTDNDKCSYRVIKRVTDNVIQIILK